MTLCSPRQQISVAAAIALFFYVFVIVLTVLPSTKGSPSPEALNIPDGSDNSHRKTAQTNIVIPKKQPKVDWSTHRHQQNDLLSTSENSEEDTGCQEEEFGEDDEDDGETKDNSAYLINDNVQGNHDLDLNSSSNNYNIKKEALSFPDEDNFVIEDEQESILQEDDEDIDFDDIHYQNFGDNDSNYSGDAMIVCGVDGTVYTLDAWTGELRGLFPSGAALVGSSGSLHHKLNDPPSVEEQDYDHRYDFDETGKERLKPQQQASSDNSSFTTERIVPGLDGHLYSLTEVKTSNNHLTSDPRLDILPISIDDVMKSPVSTCRSSGLTNQEECGIVMGQRSTKVFALNIQTGTVQWMQHASGKDGGFTTRNLFNKEKVESNKGHIVLLQREDYSVRNLDMETGEETWKVQLGRFSALDFTQKKKDVTVSTKYTQPHNRANGCEPIKTRPSSSIQSRIPELPSNSVKKRNIPGVNADCGGKIKSSNAPTEAAGFFTNPIPSIAFGKDGTSFVGLDSTTGEVLWQRKIDSIVASTYGVTSSGEWTSLNVIEDYEYEGTSSMVETDALQPYSNQIGNFLKSSMSNTIQVPLIPSTGHQLGEIAANESLPQNSKDEASLVLYNDEYTSKLGRNIAGSFDILAKVGKHSSNFFVLSTLPQMSRTGSIQGTDSFIKNKPRPQLFPWKQTSKTPPILQNGNYEESDLLNKLSIDNSYLEDDTDAVILTELMTRDGVDLSDPKSISAYLNVLAAKNKMNFNHINGGLFLTWQMIATLISLFIGLVFGGHLFYQKQKRKWISEGTPGYLPLRHDSLELTSTSFSGNRSSNKSSGSLNLLKNSPSSMSITVTNGPPPLYLEQTALPINDSEATDLSRKTDFQKKSPVLRSMSLPQFNTLSQSGENTRQSDQDGHGATSVRSNSNRSSPTNVENLKLDDDIPTIDCPESSNNDHKNDCANSSMIPFLRATTVTSSHAQSSTLNNQNTILATSNTTAIPNIIEEKQKSLLETVSNIDGIPLIRYSRYRSEFNEISRLGKGGFGTVFKCSNALDGREYAIKKVLINTGASSHQQSEKVITKKFSRKLQRVLREVKILAMLDHKNVVRYYTAWLELENDDDQVDCQDGSIGAGTEESSSLLNTTNKMARGYSSELLAGAGTYNGAAPFKSDMNSKTTTDGNSISTNAHKSNSPKLQPQNNNTDIALNHNPLGGWNSFYQAGPSLDEESWSEQKSSSSNFNETSQHLESNRSTSSITTDEDIGFTWERSNSGQFNSLGMRRKDNLSTIDDSDDDSSCASNGDDSWSSDTHNHENKTTDRKIWEALLKGQEDITEKDSEVQQKKSTLERRQKSESFSNSTSSSDKCQAEKLLVKNRRHILYIQMQLCSQKTLGDFLEKSSERLRSSNKSSRTTNDINTGNESAIDIPYALRMFSQIAQGVKHVHQQGLIHRDLKPSNCFIDDSGVIKIGDFGLSRESASAGLDENNDIAANILDEEDTPKLKDNYLGRGQDNTAGVGTRSYASPEQMNGSDYDSSTDVYSLGIILFELCYLMSTVSILSSFFLKIGIFCKNFL